MAKPNDRLGKVRAFAETIRLNLTVLVALNGGNAGDYKIYRLDKMNSDYITNLTKGSMLIFYRFENDQDCQIAYNYLCSKIETLEDLQYKPALENHLCSYLACHLPQTFYLEK
jgi:hypothetical protein